VPYQFAALKKFATQAKAEWRHLRTGMRWVLGLSVLASLFSLALPQPDGALPEPNFLSSCSATLQ